jgi:hypothetical protein
MIGSKVYHLKAMGFVKGDHPPESNVQDPSIKARVSGP